MVQTLSEIRISPSCRLVLKSLSQLKIGTISQIEVETCLPLRTIQSALGISKLFMDNQDKLNELIDIIRKKGKYVLKTRRKIDREVQFFSNILSIPADIILESIASYRFKFGVSTSSLKNVSSLTGISITREKIEELVY